MEVISNPFMYAVAPPAPTRAPMSCGILEKQVLKQRNLQTTKAGQRTKCSLKLQRQRSLLA